jgi:hypothetical protein
MAKYRIGISENLLGDKRSVRLKDLAFGGMMKVSALKKEC